MPPQENGTISIIENFGKSKEAVSPTNSARPNINKTGRNWMSNTPSPIKLKSAISFFTADTNDGENYQAGSLTPQHNKPYVPKYEDSMSYL